MKIIHCADLHLDSKMSTNLSKDKARERNNEILRTFTRMVDYAKNNSVSVIMIAGDMFDRRTVSMMTKKTVEDVIRSNPQIDFLYICGNHDTDSFLTDMEAENLCIFKDKWKSYRNHNLMISGIEVNSRNSNSFYHSLALDHDQFNIVMLHGQLAGYSNKQDAETISLDDLKNKNIDYLALGHVHEFKMDKLDARGTWCYSGCLEGRGFDECGEKGFVVLDIEDEGREYTTEFVPFASRNLYNLEVDVTGINTTREAATCIENAIKESQYSSKSLVKIVLTGEVDVEAEFNLDFLEEQFAEYFYFEKIVDQTKLQVNFRDYEKDASLKGEFARLVLASDLSEEEKTIVLRTGILALQGEEI